MQMFFEYLMRRVAETRDHRNIFVKSTSQEWPEHLINQGLTNYAK